jgi:thiol-disulfide isomerase/thioredoxin
MRTASRPWTLLTVLTLALGLATATAAGSGTESRPLVVKIHADWCGACQLLGPTWERVEKELAKEAQVVTLDVTDRSATRRSAATAAALGISPFFEKNRDRLGTIAVLRAGSREPVEVFHGELDFVAYVDAVRRAR